MAERYRKGNKDFFRYYDSIQNWAKDQLAHATSFNQTDLLTDEDYIVRIIGLTCLRDFITETKDINAFNLYFPIFKDKSENVRLMAYQEALRQSFYFPDEPVSFGIVKSALEDKWSKEIGSTILRNLRELLDRRAPKEMWASFLPLAKGALTDWHEPTREEAAFYIGHCISLGLFKDPLKTIDFVLQDKSSDVRWGIAWLIGHFKGQLMEDPANIMPIFNRFKDYSIDKYPEVHYCLTGSFTRRGPWMEALENNKEIQNYLSSLFSTSLMKRGVSSIGWVAQRTFPYDHPTLIACYREALESDNEEVRKWGEYYLNKIIKRKESEKASLSLLQE